MRMRMGALKSASGDDGYSEKGDSPKIWYLSTT
jgi:hypothetical protein